MQLFLTKVIREGTGILEGTEAKHCTKVLRHRIGAHIHCIDGQGGKYLGKISAIEQSEVRLILSEAQENWGEKSCHIRLGVSPLRLKDRFEWLIEKAVELGVNEVVPIICQRSFPHRGKWKASRLINIIQTATKQCKRSRLPVLADPISLSDFLAKESAAFRFMGYCEASEPLTSFHAEIQKAASITLLIGPEGDFSPEEVVSCQETGFKAIHFGENRLRTETAGVFALSAIKLLQAY